MKTIHPYGWKPSVPDDRDIKFSEQFMALSLVPTTKVKNIDLESQCGSPFDQLDLGSCTANAGAGLAEFLMNRLKLTFYIPSRLAIYYWERVLEHTVMEDSGASVRDVMKVMNTIGVPHEALWTYNTKKFTVKPNQQVVADANAHKIGTYLSIAQKLTELKQCLIGRYPFIFGFNAYESFESEAVANTGILPMPSKTEQALGGHCVMAVGFNDKTKMFKIKNSWGANWGQKGYFFMPYDYILNPDLADDFWTAKTIN